MLINLNQQDFTDKLIMKKVKEWFKEQTAKEFDILQRNNSGQ